MADLDDDIARIAALRGGNAAALIEKAHKPPLLRRDMVERILPPFELGSMADDALWFDMLPPTSRAFLRECEKALSARWWAWNLHESGFQEDELIKAVQYLLDTTGDGP